MSSLTPFSLVGAVTFAGLGRTGRIIALTRQSSLPCLILLTDDTSTGKRNDEENAKEKLYIYATHVPVASFKVSSASLFLRSSGLTHRSGSRDCDRGCGVNAWCTSHPSCLSMSSYFVTLLHPHAAKKSIPKTHLLKSAPHIVVCSIRELPPFQGRAIQKL